MSTVTNVSTTHGSDLQLEGSTGLAPDSGRAAEAGDALMGTSVTASRKATRVARARFMKSLPWLKGLSPEAGSGVDRMPDL